MGWPKCYVKIRWLGTSDGALCINVFYVFKTGTFKIRFKADFFFFFNAFSCGAFVLARFTHESFSSLCNVGHPKRGHSVCHCTLKSSKLGLKLSATIHVCWPICCLLWQLWRHIVVHLKTLSTSFDVTMDDTFSSGHFSAVLFSCLFGDCFWLAVSWLGWPGMQAPLNTYRLKTWQKKGFLMQPGEASTVSPVHEPDHGN